MVDSKKTLNNLHFITPFLSEENKKRLMQLPAPERDNVINAYANFLIDWEFRKLINNRIGKDDK